ncbi:hypothetical protein GCM10011371_21830 [Novosphingobium marinum]|uniref:DUF3604 domain-containing protein n=1 Tax=Novosphingobium marinum TaxID=1514948 RepID=A0A7Y9XXC1_9SPHN|nr:DUF3604 domain-containing protein [Novosphingobium marinum]NYH96297.1 hypothetical protein [Novosphingobium marinum]GGC34103.1 hypothetical protein GCM10011371_21830 [Novosphingobium marinum]
MNYRNWFLAGSAILLASVSVGGAPSAPAQTDDDRGETGTSDMARSYSPPLREPSENMLLWGDLHLHTNQSPDAFLNGTRSVSPEDAYRFALGEVVKADGGRSAKLRRPLDFIAITDHSEYLGVFPKLVAGNQALLSWPLGRQMAEFLERGDKQGVAQAFDRAITSGDASLRPPDESARSIWAEVSERADRFNQPGRFTALVGYEWTTTISGDNLHRVVIFRDGADKTSAIRPFTAQDSQDPEDLWNALAGYGKQGISALAIAHNGNVSNGRMFAPTRLNGQPLNARYAEMRSRWEPVYEVTQVKGDGEAHPALSPTDEFADFETWDTGNIALTRKKAPWMLKYEYARSALREGLRHERATGANPFKFGMIGSTDSHTGLATTAEDNFFGKFVESEPSPDRWKEAMYGILQQSWELGASGLTAVWAPENTREAIFDALRRREVYGTTGSRIRLRFFGGYDFEKRDIDRPDYARYAYSRGVPMGSDLGRSGNAPAFLVHAVRDPDSANLDRVQIIKGWLDANGQTHEKIYDVALSDGRHVGPDGKAPPVGDTVDLANATYENSIGDPELAAFWSDPDFDPAQPAFYYVRVLEIPRPRWTAYDAAFFGLTIPGNVRMKVQDRAYSSPIWYRP